MGIEEQLSATNKRATMTVESHQKVQRELEEVIFLLANMIEIDMLKYLYFFHPLSAKVRPDCR